MTADILVPELGAPDEAEQTFKSNLADKANQNTKDIAQTSQDISDLADRVTELEGATGELEVTVKKYFGTDLITPFESNFDFVDVTCRFDVDFDSTPTYRLWLADRPESDGSVNRTIFNQIVENFNGSGSQKHSLFASLAAGSPENGQIAVLGFGTSGTVTVSNISWIVRRYRIL